MLQRLNNFLDEELYAGDGLWTREELLAMNQSFVTAMEQAFASGDESRTVAAMTVRIGSVPNGKVVEGALADAWKLLCDRRGELAAAEIVAFVRERCPHVNPAFIRERLALRLRQQGAGW